MYANIHKRPSDNRTKYANLIQNCVNKNFLEQYNLSLRTSIEYCESNDQALGNGKILNLN